MQPFTRAAMALPRLSYPSAWRSLFASVFKSMHIFLFLQFWVHKYFSRQTWRFVVQSTPARLVSPSKRRTPLNIVASARWIFQNSQYHLSFFKILWRIFGVWIRNIFSKIKGATIETELIYRKDFQDSFTLLQWFLQEPTKLPRWLLFRALLTNFFVGARPFVPWPLPTFWSWHPLPLFRSQFKSSKRPPVTTWWHRILPQIKISNFIFLNSPSLYRKSMWGERQLFLHLVN